MYYPPLFTSVRPYDPRTNTLGGPLDVPVVGTGRENPLDLSVKTIRQTPDSTAEAEDLLMLDHRKLASLAASHSLSAMGRQLNPTSALLDPALFRLSYGATDSTSCSHAAAMIPGLAPPFCYDRATGVAVPTTLAGHQLMNSFLQQQQHHQQRERCLEQQHQALLAARNSAQQAAVAAAAFMDPASLPLHLRGTLSQRDAAIALAASRGLYAPTLPTPMVLPAFSLYTDDKGAFTSLRNSNADKAYLNGAATNALEAARFAEHLQRLRDQHLQQTTGKCNNACCTPTTLSALSQTTVPCACCLQSPSQAALCSRSPMGCSMKDTTGATGKVCSTNCDYMQPSLTLLHRPTAATAAPTDLRLSGYCTSDVTSSSGSNQRVDNASLFQPSSIWTSGLSTVSSGKTAFSVPKKKDTKESSHRENTPKVTTPSSKDCFIVGDKGRISPADIKSKCSFSTDFPKKEEKEIIVIGDESPRRKPHLEKYAMSKLTSHSYSMGNNGAVTNVTTATSTVPTKCEGGTIPIAKVPNILDGPRLEDTSYNSVLQNAQSSSMHSSIGPPPLVTAPSGPNLNIPNFGKIHPTALDPSLRLPIPTTLYTDPVKDLSEKQHVSKESSKPPANMKSPKKEFGASKSIIPPSVDVKEEDKKTVSNALQLHKPIPQMPSHHHHLPTPHYASHYPPPSHVHISPQHPIWTTVQPGPPLIPQPTAVSAVTTPTTSSSRITPNHHEMPSTTNIKREPDYAENASNVLQSLLIRPGLEPTGTATVNSPLNPAFVKTAPGSFAGIDYHLYHNRHVPVHRSVDSQVAYTCPEKRESAACEGPVLHANVLSKKRPNSDTNDSMTKSDGCPPEKKRITYGQYSPAEYAFQNPAYSSIMPDLPQNSYVVSAAGNQNFTQQVAEIKAEMPSDLTFAIPLKNIEHPVAYEEKTTSVHQPLQKADDVPPQYNHLIREHNRNFEEPARRKLRVKLLARLFQRKKLLGSKDKTVSLNQYRRLLSQLTLKWRRRRQLYQFHAARRKRLGSELTLHRRMKRKKSKFTTNRGKNMHIFGGDKKLRKMNLDSEKKAKAEQHGSLAIPIEMKKLMVNKALGETILHRAARLGYAEVVAYCLETGCGNVNARDNAGYTPLHECCSRGHLDIARALLQYGADVNGSAAGGIRPLHDAVENDHVEVVRLLLSFGADPSIATYSGLVPLKLARSPLMAEFLQGFMADISGEVDNRPHLPWRFWGSASCIDPEDIGYDVFRGVPSDPEADGEGEDDFLFEVSDSPHLPTFRLPLPAAGSKVQCNYLRLTDVLKKTLMSKEYFLENYCQIEVYTIPRHEFEASATCSQLLTGTKLDNVFACPRSDRLLDVALQQHQTIDVVKLDNSIRKILGIETISVR